MPVSPRVPRSTSQQSGRCPRSAYRGRASPISARKTQCGAAGRPAAPPVQRLTTPSPDRIGPRRPALLDQLWLPPRFTRTGSRETFPLSPSRRSSQQSPRRLKGEAASSAPSEGAKQNALGGLAALKEPEMGYEEECGKWKDSRLP
ncbi:PREDICTED: uncharacterized protein LOC106148464 isoform X2 [Chinchilla lanigera]|uniref:uncharacterized protein LOC106148464 isoform X2 n=1 Tax=Chinchilla lanigera TaxID=34839 RepID=UPI0006979659|nr:PREDICTED: uncharacterized protein LOC106148464 isoform X2 [Chinchilla lanigera]